MKKKKSNLRSCNVLEVGPEHRRLWQFNAVGKVSLSAEQTLPPQVPLPAKAVSKDWRSLWQTKLNIAWLPSDHVFLRIIHLPAAELAEISSMVELQLEKLSPLPVNQIVWSFEALPLEVENLQPVVVIIVARSVVDEFLGKLETQGFLADRLEIPHLHQLLAARPDHDAVEIYPVSGNGRTLCVVAWWIGGILRGLELLHLSESTERAQMLVNQLTKTAWAGEMEGWLTAPLGCVLIASADDARIWGTALGQWSDKPVEIVEPLPRTALAELTASGAAREESKANLLPADHAARYHQQFVDRLWMSGLAAVTVAYVLGVAVYFGFLQFLKYQKVTADRQVAAVSQSYTNALKMKARADVLQNQLNLKYAALDCLRVASEHLPGELSLIQFDFSRGQTLTLQGHSPSGQVDPIYTYNAALRDATINGEPLFSKVDQPNYVNRGSVIDWRFSCELNRPQTE